MTFSHGEYVVNKYVEKWDNTFIAEELFKKALTYNHDLDAYLGLGMLFQKRGGFIEAISVLKKGLGFFPGSYDLNVCMGICCMNTMDFPKALNYFNKFQDIPAVQQYIDICNNKILEYNKNK